MTKQKKPTKKVNFTKAYKELEEITQDFEGGDIDLEESIPKFKRGLELARMLKGRLSEIENTIEEIKDDYADVEDDNS